MGIFVSILVAVVAFLFWDIGSYKSKVEAQSTQIAELNSKLSDKTSQETFERKKACAIQADGFVKKLGYDLATDNVSAQNHYNVKQDKCFLKLSSNIISKSSISNSALLFDAYEQKIYAESSSYSDGGFSCDITPPGGVKIVCRTKEDFNQYVGNFMD